MTFRYFWDASPFQFIFVDYGKHNTCLCYGSCHTCLCCGRCHTFLWYGSHHTCLCYGRQHTCLSLQWKASYLTFSAIKGSTSVFLCCGRHHTCLCYKRQHSCLSLLWKSALLSFSAMEGSTPVFLCYERQHTCLWHAVAIVACLFPSSLLESDIQKHQPFPNCQLLEEESVTNFCPTPISKAESSRNSDEI